MTDRVYPASKPNGATTNGVSAGAAAATNGGTTAPTFPPPKSQQYNPTRHPYRPQPNVHHDRRSRRTRRGCFCVCCFWSILVIIALLLLAAIAGAAVYVLYRPHLPNFSVSALRIAQFNVSTSAGDDITRLITRLNLTVFARNPNKKIVFFYDPITINTFWNQVAIGNGSFPGFTSKPGNSTVIRSQQSLRSEPLDAGQVTTLRSDLKKKLGLPLKLDLETKVIVKMDGLKSNKIGMSITCDGIHCLPPKGKSPAVASISTAKCKVDLQIKIWKFKIPF